MAKKMKKPCKAQVRRTVAGGKGRFYVHACQDTGGVFICERGVDNNIAEVFARNDNETVGDNAIFIANALNLFLAQVNGRKARVDAILRGDTERS